jgi:hypothetical protein
MMAISRAIIEGEDAKVRHALTLANMILGPALATLAATPEGRELMAGTVLASYLDRMNARVSMLHTTWERLLAA